MWTRRAQQQQQPHGSLDLPEKAYSLELSNSDDSVPAGGAMPHVCQSLFTSWREKRREREKERDREREREVYYNVLT